MTSETSPLMTDSGQPENPDLSSANSDARRRQLDIFRQRELETEPEESISAL